MEVKKEGDQFLSEMMRANMGEVPKRPSEVREDMAKKIDSVLSNGSGDLKNEVSKYIEPLLEVKKNQ
nr:hypothetical protein [uncultured Flavobacterium sp.]